MAYTKECKKCHLIKPLNEFRIRKDNGHHRHTCLQCEYDFHKEYIKNNKIKDKQIKAKYYENNKEKIIKNSKEYYKNNYKKISERRKVIYIQFNDKIRSKARESSKKNRKNITAQELKRIKEDPLFRFKKLVRQSVRVSFKKKGCIKSLKTQEILGCSLDNFYKYIINTYKNNYNENYNNKIKVHIDHIIPLSIAKDESEVIKLCHYTNLQLLKAEDNLEKSNKLNWKKGGQNYELC